MIIDFGKQRSRRVLLLTGAISLFGVAIEAQALLTIDKSMEIAVDNSPDMQQTELSLVRSQERLNAQRARLKSQFSITLMNLIVEKVNPVTTDIWKPAKELS